MSIFFKRIKNEEDFKSFVEESMQTDMYCAGCGCSTKNRGLYIDNNNPKRNLLYGLCNECQKKCLKSKRFAEDISSKISRTLNIENN